LAIDVPKLEFGNEITQVLLIIDKTYKKLIMSSMNIIDWKPKALKQLEKIKQSSVRKKIYTETQTLADFPNCQGVKNWLIMLIVTVCE